MSKVYTFWSSNGGVGKTTISTCVAYNLAKKNKHKKVLLLDFNLVNPDTDFHLKINNVKDLKELSTYFTTNTFTETILNSAVYSYPRQPNFHILSGLYDINFFDKIVMKDFVTIVEVAKKAEYDYILIDVDNSLNVDATFVGLTQADKVFIVSDGMYHSIRNTNRYIEEALSKIDIDDSKINIVVNKYDKDISDKEEIKRLLDRKDTFFIESDKNVPLHINKGIPFIECKDKKSKNTKKEFDLLTEYIMEL